MKTPLVPFAAAFALLAGVAQAHHSGAAFDPTKPVTLSGKVTKVEWLNPHARFYIDVKGADGATVNWNIELPSPNTLMRKGWRRDSLKTGDQITVLAAPARDHQDIAVAEMVTDAVGRSLFVTAADATR
jgi:Family of unknown function (DUF6152)